MRRRRAGGRQRRRRAQHLRAAAHPPRRGPRRRSSATSCASTATGRPQPVGAARRQGRGRRPTPVRIGLIGKYVDLPGRLPVGGREPEARRLPPRRQGRDRLDPGRGGRGPARRRTARASSTAWSSPAASATGASRARSPRPSYAREERRPVPRALPRAAGDDDRVRPQRARPRPTPTRPSSTRRRQHPVIDLMHDQRDVSDKGGTMRLGAYYAVLEPGTQGRRRLRRAGRQRAPPSPLRVQLALPQPRLEAHGFVCSRHVARPPPRRVHRARRTTRTGSARRPTPSSRAARIARIRCSAS